MRALVIARIRGERAPENRASLMTTLLYAIFFASGASALIFETLWFRQAGLALGNSVWASSLVLSGFMGGLTLGNAVGARYGGRVVNPVRAYAIAEVAIALTGVGLVYLFPVLGAGLAPWLRPLLVSGHDQHPSVRESVAASQCHPGGSSSLDPILLEHTGSVAPR